jgi:hypothetical protein
MLKVTVKKSNNEIYNVEEVIDLAEFFIEGKVGDEIVIDSISLLPTIKKNSSQYIKDKNDAANLEPKDKTSRERSDREIMYSSNYDISNNNSLFKKEYKAIITIITEKKKKVYTLITNKDEGRATVEYDAER